jgi:hypothetical protein
MWPKIQLTLTHKGLADQASADSRQKGWTKTISIRFD